MKDQESAVKYPNINQLLDSILIEWSYRLKDGIPDIADVDKIPVLNEILSEQALPLYEAGFDLADISKYKYYTAWLDRIEKKQPFEIDGETTKISIDPKSSFALALKKTKGDPDKLQALFKYPGGTKYRNIIPGKGDELYPLSKISKRVFTVHTTTSELTDLNTPEAKEGMAAFFYMLPETQLELVHKKITMQTPDAKLALDSSIVDDKILGSKSKRIVDSVIVFLNETQFDKTKNKKELLFLLNAYSIAITIRKKWGVDYTIDRGIIFNKVRKAGSIISGIAADKWNPGDVYIYKDAAVIDSIRTAAEKSKLLVSITDSSEELIGLNSIFDAKNPAAISLSLKEESALAGGATSFLAVKTVKGTDIKSTARITPEQKKLIIDIGFAEKRNKEIKNVDSLLKSYEKKHIALRTELEKVIKKVGKIKKISISESASKEQSKNMVLYNLIKKDIGYTAMIDFFNKFDSIKNINSVMQKYKNPLSALTAYGVSLSGFNPTFYKIIANASGNTGHIDIFHGRDSLDIIPDTMLIYDAPSKAGFKLQFLTLMGQKKYQTSLDVRFKGDFEFTITVEDFAEKSE